MKKLLCVLWLVCGLYAVAELKDGIYAGKAKGYKGPVSVAVTVKEGMISQVEIIESLENRPRSALKDIPRRIVKENSTDVDVVSGATITSAAIKSAVCQALEDAH